MATTLMPVDPAVSAQRVNRVLTISANLLPEEIIAGRRGRRIRTWVIVMVVLVAALCGAWIYNASRDKQAAEEELNTATSEVADLQRAQNKYASVVQLRAETELLKTQLKTTMADDLDWAAVLSMLQSTGEPMDIVVEGVTGALNDKATGEEKSASAALPSTSKSGSVGQLTVTGSAPDKEAVAAYVDALAVKPTLANPYVTSVTSDEETKGVAYSLTVDVTRDALCGRFTEACKSTGGK